MGLEEQKLNRPGYATRQGTVKETLPNAFFKVELESGI